VKSSNPYQLIPHYHDLIENRIDLGKVPGTILAIDPGGTWVGIAILKNGEPVQAGQLKGNYQQLLRMVRDLIDQIKPDHIVVEAYRIYSSHRDEHVGSDVPTLRLVGAIEMLCIERDIPITKQSAMDGKAFMTDVKLKAWGVWQPNKPHANDALRHGLRYVLFTKEHYK
jgi:hypothetical protein